MTRTKALTAWLRLAFGSMTFLFLGSAAIAQPPPGAAAPPPAMQQHRGDPLILKGIDLIYERLFDDAEALFNKAMGERPAEPAIHFYRAMITWSRLTAGFWSPLVVREFENRIDQAIAAARKPIDDKLATSYDFFYLGGALGFKGRYELMKDNWLTSFFLAKEAVEALKTCLRMDPDNKDVLLGIGTFDYYTARFSGIKKFLAYLLLHEGNKEEGLRKLTIASREAIYSATESQSMLLHIYLFFEEEFPKALDLAVRLTKRYPRNPRFKALEGVAYVRLGAEGRVRETVTELRRRATAASDPKEAGIWNRQALYLESVHALFLGRLQDAREILQQILNQPDPEADPAMIAWPLLKIGMSYDLENNRQMARDYYRRVLDLENGAGAHVLVERFLDRPPAKGDPFLGY